MVITLTYSGTQKGTKDDVTFYFPVNPSRISYKSAAYFHEYTIINKGPVKVPSGEDISTIGWEGFFPGAVLKNQKYVRKWKDPASLHKQLESWRKNGTKLKLNITGTPFSMWVYIDSYEASVEDAIGNISYTIEFSQAIELTVEKIVNKNKTTSTRTTKKSTEKKYTIKKGDTLWGIAVKYYKSGTQWKKIYNANKTTIENAAKKHKKKSSDNGHWIYPGTVLKIP